MLIFDQVVEVVVGELVLNCLDHLLVVALFEIWRARQEPQILHVVLIAIVDDRPVEIISEHNLIVGLTLVRPVEKPHVAIVIMVRARRALGIAMDTRPLTAFATLT